MSDPQAHLRKAGTGLGPIPRSLAILPPVDLPAEGTILSGRYRLVRAIGSGGMGAVYEAEHLKLRQRVAIKLLHPSLTGRPDIVARFEREARAATQLTSPHVARVTDVDVTPDGAPYMVMEFLEGRDLSKELAQTGPLPISTAVGFVLQACDAMIEAHALGIVHRDLKPGNLFLAEAGGRRTLKVLDFGISKVASDTDEPSLTSTFSALGTALYMSPEQVRSAKKVDLRSDIWSLGVILFEALAGRTPFEGESATSVAASIVADPVPSLRALRPDLPEALEAVVYGALAKDREQRYQSMGAFAVALGQFGPETSRPSLPLVSDLGAISSPSVRIAAVTEPLVSGPSTAPGWSRAPSESVGRKVPQWALAAALAGVAAVTLLAGSLVWSSVSREKTVAPMRLVISAARSPIFEARLALAKQPSTSDPGPPQEATPAEVPPAPAKSRTRSRQPKAPALAPPPAAGTAKPATNPNRL